MGMKCFAVIEKDLDAKKQRELKEEALHEIVNQARTDGHDGIGFEEFAQLRLRILLIVNVEYVLSVFNVLDRSGYRDEDLRRRKITEEDLRHVLQMDNIGELDRYFGLTFPINFGEFRLAMKET